MTLHFSPPALDAYEAAVDDAIATCNGDLRGALKALIIANEFLERNLEKILAGNAVGIGIMFFPPPIQQPSIKKED